MRTDLGAQNHRHVGEISAKLRTKPSEHREQQSYVIQNSFLVDDRNLRFVTGSCRGANQFAIPALTAILFDVRSCLGPVEVRRDSFTSVSTLIQIGFLGPQMICQR